IGVLMALLLPAVQQARAAALRTECLNNLKQIGLAAHQYHDTRRVFPAGMRFQDWKDPQLMSSWLAAILPLLEQDNLWTVTRAAYQQSQYPFKNPPHIGLATVIPTFVCPSDPRGGQAQMAQRPKSPWRSPGTWEMRAWI